MVHGALQAEAAAHVGGEDPDLLGRKPQGHGHGVPDEIGVLGRRPDHEGAGIRVRIGEDAPGLDRHPGDPRMVQALLDDEVRRRQRGLHRAGRAPNDDGRIVGPVRVDPVVAPRRRVDRHHRREGLVVDGHRVHRVGEAIGVVRHHDGDGLADVAHHLAGQRDLDVGARARRAAERGRDPARDLGKVGGGEDEDTRQRPGGVRADAGDASVRVKASHHAEVKRVRPAQVVEIAAAPEEERRVFPAARRGPDGARRARRHRVATGGSAWAARRRRRS